MNAKQIKIKLSEIAYEATSNCDGAVSSDDADLGQIVEISGGRMSIVDGFHRTAGQVAYCRDNDIDPADYEITVVQAFDEQLIADAAEPSTQQNDAVAEIYRQADWS